MNKHPEITADTKQAFVTAFISLNKKMPIEKISVRLLTEKAGYNRTTFYNYFNDVYDLYRYLEQYLFENIRGQIEQNLRNTNSETDYVLRFVKIYSEWKAYFETVINNPYNQHFVSQLKNQLIAYWTKELHLPTDDIKVSYQLDYMLSAAFSIMSRWLKNQADMTPEEFAELLRTATAHGVLNDLISNDRQA